MMKVLNLMWGASLGGVGKCFLSYAKLGEIEPKLKIHSVCINLNNEPSDLRPFEDLNVRIVNIRNRGDFSWLTQCRNIISQMNPDIIFTHGFNGPVVVQMLKWRYGLTIPIVCSYHGEYHPPCPSRRFVAPLFNSVMHQLYRYKASGVLAVAAWCKDDLVQRGIAPKKVVVVHNGVAAADSKRGRGLVDLMPSVHIEKASIVVGTASRLDRVKGLEYLLKAVATVRASGRQVLLVVLGDGPLRNPLKKLAADLRIADDIIFMGAQVNVPEWLDAIDIFALPSLFEYHSISLLEAMRAGKAIVASHVGGTPESVRDGQEALLVPPADTQALVVALTRLADDADLRIRLGVAARKRFESEFTEEIMKRRLADWLLSFSPSIQSL